MCITTITEFERIAEPERSSLLFLRAQRDRLAEWLCVDASSLEEEVEDMIHYQYEGASYHLLKSYFEGRGCIFDLECLEVFRRFCHRIARIERELCGYYVESNLRTA